MSESTPQTETHGIQFFPIPEFSDVDIAFGADAKEFLPRRDGPEIPKQFVRDANSLFFDGGELPDMHPAVDRRKASRALNAWLTSFAPAHEAKQATVGYALWLWTHPTALDGADQKEDAA